MPKARLGDIVTVDTYHETCVARHLRFVDRNLQVDRDQPFLVVVGEVAVGEFPDILIPLQQLVAGNRNKRSLDLFDEDVEQLPVSGPSEVPNGTGGEDDVPFS